MPPTNRPEYRRFLVRLRAARTSAGLSQAVVAKHLRKTQAFVSKSERGERRVDAVELAAFARVYGRDLRFFVSSESRRGANG